MAPCCAPRVTILLLFEKVYVQYVRTVTICKIFSEKSTYCIQHLPTSTNKTIRVLAIFVPEAVDSDFPVLIKSTIVCIVLHFTDNLSCTVVDARGWLT